MRLRRFALPVVLVSVLILLVGVTAGLISARDQAPPAAPPKVIVSAPDLAVTPEPEIVPPATTEPENLIVPEPARKSAPDTQMGPSSESPEGSEGSRPALEGASQGTVYTWQDGDKAQRAVLQARPAVRETVADATEDDVIKKDDIIKDVIKKDGVIKKEELDSIVREQSERDSGGQPLFRSESGGELMTLPGGIVLALDPEWDRDAVESFFSRNGIALERSSELDFLDNGFFVETEPGFPSLELANTLASQDGVILSSPNWAREVESK